MCTDVSPRGTRLGLVLASKSARRNTWHQFTLRMEPHSKTGGGDPLGVEPRTYYLRVNGQFSPGMRAHNCTRFAWVRSYVSTAL